MLQQESELKAEEDDSPYPVLEDEVPVEDSELPVEELSPIPSGDEVEEGLPEDAVVGGETVDDRLPSGVEGRDRREGSEGVGAVPELKGSGGWGVKKVSIFLFFAVISVVGSVSVVGLLQSSESVGSSGIVVQSPPPPAPALPSAPPPEPKIDIDVYSDWGCTVSLTRVEWGSVEAGGSVDRVVYVRNAGDYGVVLSLLTEGWDPAGASEHMGVSWDYDGGPIEAGGVVEIVLTLSVEASTPVLGGFTFDIVFVGVAS